MSCRNHESNVMRKSSRACVWRECMGIEPTQARVGRPAFGFEDRDGHQAASTPVLHDDDASGPGSSDFTDVYGPVDGRKIVRQARRRDADEKAA